MADWIVLEGVPPFDGRYELAIGDQLTTREWGWIKRLAGYLPTQVDVEALGDPEFITCLAAIALRRAGRVEAAEVPALYERLADAPPTAAFRIESDPEEDEAGADAGPPAENLSASASTSGAPSPPSSETSEQQTPPASGMPGSVTSLSDRATSGS